jgi:hypothetical protein
MAAPSIKSVIFTFVKTTPNQLKLERTFHRLGNWARLSLANWFVWTDLSPQQMYDVLRHEITTDDQLFIFPINVEDKAGWGPPWFWQWFDKVKLSPPSYGPPQPPPAAGPALPPWWHGTETGPGPGLLNLPNAERPTANTLLDFINSMNKPKR